MSLTFNSIGQSLGNNMKASENDFNNFMQNMDSSDPSQMIEMQRKMQEWTLSVQMQTSTIKSLGDALRGVIQKMN
ncbi:EscF/YscF/HrpA family type III secretion system needle major subunit [Thalassospira sp. MA62]|nr:EscF/YscF/HrpA family type III secretion system needle major subunit [Thalassospira sp. MA62]